MLSPLCLDLAAAPNPSPGVELLKATARIYRETVSMYVCVGHVCISAYGNQLFDFFERFSHKLDHGW